MSTCTMKSLSCVPSAILGGSRHAGNLTETSYLLTSFVLVDIKPTNHKLIDNTK